jgi:foldase protein PrsA
MSKRLLLGIVVVLIITNIATLLFWYKGETVVVDEDVRVRSNGPVASIAGESISFEDWMRQLRLTNGEQQLKTMIDRTVVKQLAKENKIKVPDKVIDRELSLLTSMQGVMTKEETKALQASWREDIRYRYQLEALLTKDISIDEQKVKEFYEKYKNQYNFKSAMQLSHIVVKDKDVAEKVIKELDDGASFDLLAREYSIDEDSKKDGGYLGFITTSSQFFPSEYESTIKDMKSHSYSEPIKVNKGYAVVYLHQLLPSIEFTYDEIKPYVKSELALQESGQSLTADPLWKKLDIEWIYEKK